MLELVDEPGMADCVVGLAQVDVDCQRRGFAPPMLVDIVNNCLYCEGGAGVWSKCILSGRDDVVCCQVVHELVVDGCRGVWR